MNPGNHIPEHWRIGDAGHTIFGPPNGSPSPQIIATNVSRANAIRIVACVNACAGMANPAVELSSLRSRSDNIPAMCAEVEVMRVEIAALRAAIHKVAGYFGMIDSMQPNRKHGQIGDEVRLAVRAALKGGAE